MTGVQDVCYSDLSEWSQLFCGSFLWFINIFWSKTFLSKMGENRGIYFRFRLYFAAWTIEDIPGSPLDHRCTGSFVPRGGIFGSGGGLY